MSERYPDLAESEKRDANSAGAMSPMLIGRYLVVGGANTIVSYAIYCFFLFLGVNYALASFGALLLGIMLSFITLGRLVFVSRLEGRFGRFVLVWAGVYLVNIALIHLILRVLGDAYLAGLLAAPPTIAAAFLLQRVYVFSNRRNG